MEGIVMGLGVRCVCETRFWFYVAEVGKRWSRIVLDMSCVVVMVE